MAIRELFARFEFAWDQGVLGKLTAASQRAEGKVRQVAGAFGQAQARATAARGSLGAWTNLARQSGASAAALGAAVQGLQQRAQAAAAGDTRLAASFRELGVDLERLTTRGRSASSVWTEITGRLAAVENGARRSRLALRLLGNEGSRIALPNLNQGVVGLRAALRGARSVTPTPQVAPAAVPPPTGAPRVAPIVVPPPTGLARARQALASLGQPLDRIRQRWRTLFTGGQAAKAAAELRTVERSATRAGAATGKLKGAMSDALAAFGIFGGVFGAVFAGGAIVRGVKNTLQQVDATAKLAKQLGLTAEAMQALDAAANLSGLSIEELRVGVTTMTRNLGLFAATGEGRAVRVLKEMGVGLDEIKERSPDQLFWQFGKAIAGIEDPVKRSAFAQRIFGESGARLLSLFHGSAEEIDALKKRTEELGIVFTDDFAASVEKTNDEMHLAGLQFERLRVNLIGAIAPALLWIATRVINLGQAFKNAMGNSNALRAAFLSGGWMLFAKLLGRLFAGVGGIRGALAKLWPVVLRIGRVLLPWIAWTLILDDVITFLKGGDSALGRFLDTLFGAGTAKSVLEWIRDAWKDIVEQLRRARDALRNWVAGADEDTKKAAAVFGAFVLVASTGIGKLIFQLGVLAAAWTAQVVKTGLAAAAWATGQVAAIAFSGSLSTMALAAGAAAAAVLAIWAAVDQFRKLLDEVGGWDGLLGGVKSFFSGEGFFAGVDAEADRKARAEAKARLAKTRESGDTGEFGVRVGAEPALRGGATTNTRNVTLTDRRTVNVNVGSGAQPAATGRAVASAVSRTQHQDLGALRGALVGAGRD